MIVRILNQPADRDSFYDCRNCCLKKLERDGRLSPTEHVLILEFLSDEPIEVILDGGDEIYYMNDSGKTVHANYRMVNKKPKH